MAIEHKVWNFPTFPIRAQLFHVPGASVEGGYTSGGARISSPEPGGFGVLEIQPALHLEWEYPVASWLMSKTNGQILRVRLAATPQVASARAAAGVPWGAETIYPDSPWSNLQNWSGDLAAQYATPALEGSNVLVIDMSQLGPLLRHGHVIGHGDSCYGVDDIEYDSNGRATILTTLPLRRDVAEADSVWFRPWFTGSIGNPGDFKSTYDADKVGHIQLEKIILNEVVL